LGVSQPRRATPAAGGASGRADSVQRHGGLTAKRQGSLPPALADHAHHIVLEVQILDAHTEQLGAARPGVEQHHEERGVAAGVEVLAGAGSEQGTQLGLAQDRDGLVRHGRRAHLRTLPSPLLRLRRAGPKVEADAQ